MGFRFRRSLRMILPGLNVGKRGVSTSLGVRGAWLTFGHHGTRATASVSGSGLSYSSTIGHDTHQEGRRTAHSPPMREHVSIAQLLVLIALIGFLVHFILNP